MSNISAYNPNRIAPPDTLLAYIGIYTHTRAFYVTTLPYHRHPSHLNRKILWSSLYTIGGNDQWPTKRHCYVNVKRKVLHWCKMTSSGACIDPGIHIVIQLGQIISKLRGHVCNSSQKSVLPLLQQTPLLSIHFWCYYLISQVSNLLPFPTYQPTNRASTTLYHSNMSVSTRQLWINIQV